MYEFETDQAIEKAAEIMHIIQGRESKYEKSDRHETLELNMLPKELYEENYEAINVARRLVKKTQGRKVQNICRSSNDRMLFNEPFDQGLNSRNAPWFSIFVNFVLIGCLLHEKEPCDGPWGPHFEN
ncbi:uncharacterized protein TNCV_687401 [Trichonephila clavipes]|nr:uncharacterized protein TNCV_687401 [Trichonephila clavipes]